MLNPYHRMSSAIHRRVIGPSVTRQSHYGAVVLQDSRHQLKRDALIERGDASLFRLEILQNITSMRQCDRRRVSRLPARAVFDDRQLKINIPAETLWSTRQLTLSYRVRWGGLICVARTKTLCFTSFVFRSRAHTSDHRDRFPHFVPARDSRWAINVNSSLTLPVGCSDETSKSIRGAAS